jgi:hypothetical protein
MRIAGCILQEENTPDDDMIHSEDEILHGGRNNRESFIFGKKQDRQPNPLRGRVALDESDKHALFT